MDMLELLDVNWDITGEWDIKDSTIGEARDTLDKQVEHLTSKGLQNNNSHEFARVGEGGGYERHNNMRLPLSHVELQNCAVVRGWIYHLSRNLVLNRTDGKIALDLEVDVIRNLSTIYYWKSFRTCIKSQSGIRTASRRLNGALSSSL